MSPRAFLFLLAAATAAVPPAASGAEPVRDLGEGLLYYRIHELPADLPRHSSPSPAVLDLRYAKSDDAGGASLRAWIAFNASAKVPVLVIENASTATSLKAVLASNGTTGLVVLAPESSKLDADVLVPVSPSADRAGFEALEKGTPIESLLSDYPDKPRIDEAYLEKAHIPDSEAPEVPGEKDLPPRPLTDPLLQRAVQLHRGLVALKRI